MPSGKTHFNPSWLLTIDSNGQRLSEWCREGKDVFHGYCRLCNNDIKSDNAGKSQLLQHAKKEKHKHASKLMRDNSQTKLFVTVASTSNENNSSSSTSSDKTLTSINYNDAFLTAQIYWLAKVSLSNYSLRSVDHIGDTFRAMFPDSKIAKEFSLSRTSASYMISNGLKPYFKGVLCADIKSSQLPFSIHFDETTTTQVKKQMDLTVRYWSPTHNEVWVAYYTSLMFGHAEGKTVASKMMAQLLDDNMPIDKLSTLVRDGPNVNKTIFSALQKSIKEECPDFPGFVDLGSCILHTVHNAFGKGLEKLSADIDQLCRDVHALFKHSAARREDYEKLQFELDIATHQFQQHTEVRWLSLGPAISRILEQWDALLQFVKYLGKDPRTTPKSVNYRRVAALLATGEKDATKFNLEFLNNIIPIFEDFLTLFQRSTPTVHLVYDLMCQTLTKLMRRFLKSDAMKGKYGTELSKLPCEDIQLRLADEDIVMGDHSRDVLQRLNKEKQRSVMLGVRSFFCAAIGHLQHKLPLQNHLLQDLGCLNPNKLERKSTQSAIQSIARRLQPDVDVSCVLDEWKALQNDDDIATINKEQRIDHYWNEIFMLKSVSNTDRYSVLPCIIKSGLVLAQMNAESERSLSINARLVTNERSTLGDNTICGLRAVKDAVHFYDPVNNQPEKIPVTKEMKMYVKSAHVAYKAMLEDEKKEQARKREQARQKSDVEERLRKEKEQMVEKKQALVKQEEDLIAKEKKATSALKEADELLSDATQKLHNAISEPIMNQQSVKVASTMIDVAKSKRENAMKTLETIKEKQKLLDNNKMKLLEKAIPSKTTKKKAADSDESGVPKKKAK